MVVDFAEIGNPLNTKRGFSIKRLVLFKTSIKNGPPGKWEIIRILVHEQRNQQENNLYYWNRADAITVGPF